MSGIRMKFIITEVATLKFPQSFATTRTIVKRKKEDTKRHEWTGQNSCKKKIQPPND